MRVEQIKSEILGGKLYYYSLNGRREQQMLKAAMVTKNSEKL